MAGLDDHGGERLAAGDLGDQLGHLVVLDDGLGELVRVHAGLLARAHQVLGELLLVDAQLLLARRSRRARTGP